MSDINDPGIPSSPTLLATTPEPTPPPEPSGPGYIRQFYLDLVGSLTEPRRFYTERYPQMSMNYALAFGLTVSWIGAFLKWLTRIINHETLWDGFLKIRDQLNQLPLWKDLPTSIWAQNPPPSLSVFPAWIADATTLALFPFSFLINIVLSATALTIGGYLFLSNRNEDVTRDRADITHFIKIAALASTPALIGAALSFLPLSLGTFTGVIYSFFMLLFAISIRYRVSMLRAFATAVTPWLGLILVGSCVIGIFGAIIFGFFASLFGFSN